MADEPRSDAGREADAARLRDLEAKLAKLAPGPEVERPLAKFDQAHLAWRMVIELVAGLGIGLGIGYGLDYLFGTGPFLMVLFILLGLAAGIKTMMHTATEIGRKSGGQPEGNNPGQRPDSDKRD